MPSLTPRSMSSLILEMPSPNMMSNSASRNGGATLFLTILARVWLPINSPEESFRPSTRRMSMRTRGVDTSERGRRW